MFARPNGSGKSTIKNAIKAQLLGVYINPDDIEKEITTLGYLDFTHYNVMCDAKEVMDFFQKSSLIAKSNLSEMSI